MKLINQSVEYLPQACTEEDIYKSIERAGRICYKSEDKITSDSYKRFIEMLKTNGHTAMLEHGTIYLKHKGVDNPLAKYNSNPYSKYNMHYIEDSLLLNDNEEIVEYVTTNYRVIYENGWEDDLKWAGIPTLHHELRYSFHITTSIGIVRELLRHRHFSFANESTRYCNYSKGKFGNQLTFIKPSWFQTLNEEGDYEGEIRDGSNRVILGGRTFQLSSVQDFEEHYICSRLAEAENAYFHFLKQGYTPQQARDILPLATKSEIVMTGFESDWKHFLDLRLREITGKVHPDMKVLAEQINEKLIEKGITL